MDCGPAHAAGRASSALNVNRNFKITPNGTETPIVELCRRSVGIRFANDSDGVVADDTDLMVSVSVANFAGYGVNNEPVTPALLWVRVSGVLDSPSSLIATDGDTYMLTHDIDITIPAGTNEGEYTVSARVAYDVNFTVDEDDPTDITAVPTDTFDDDKIITVTKTFTVGDAGQNGGGRDAVVGQRP